VVDGRQDAGEVGHARPVGERHVGQDTQHLHQEVEQRREDGRVRLAERAVQLGLLAPAPVGDGVQLDGEQPLGQVPGQRPGVDRGHGEHAPGRAGRVHDADHHRGALGLAGALLPAEREDRVRQVRDERRHQPGDEQVETLLRGVHQVLETGQAVAVADRFRERLHRA
jgi:hypothetical protein